MKKWKEEKLGELCTIGRGSSPRPINNKAYFINGKIPWIKIADATKSGKYLYKTKEYVNEYGASFSRLMPKGTLIFSASGVSLGIPIVLGIEGCIHDGWIFLNNFNAKLDGNFLYYFLLTQQRYFLNFSYGAAIQNINTDIMKNMPIKLPNPDTQQKIAKILSNYDDLIENNNKRIKILEEMAQEIYKEWFVDFKFPGYESVTFKKSILGKIPENWQIKKIIEVYETVLGGTPSRDRTEYWNGNIPWLNSSKTNELRIITCSELITKLGLEKSSTKLMPPLTTVLAITGATLGQVSLIKSEMCANQSVVGICDNQNQEFIYYLMKNKISTLIMKASGGAHQHINKDVVNDMDFILPDDDTLKLFKNLIAPINAEIFNLLTKNETLNQTRDLLLPRLISGGIDVENLDIV